MCQDVCIEINEVVENISIEIRDFSVSNIISQDNNNSATIGSDGLLFVSENGGGASWGEIDGTLSNQTDLQNALNLKANESDLGAVAFSNDYNDLDNKPTIPNITNLVPYTGATRDVDLGYNAFRNNNGLIVSWENEFSEGEAKLGSSFYDIKQLYFRDVDKTNNFQYSAQTIDFICNLEEGWGVSNNGLSFDEGVIYGSTVFNRIGGAGLNTQRGNNNFSQIKTSAGDIILSNLTDNAGPLMQSYIRLWKDYTQLIITNNDTSEANSIEMYTDRTYTKKYITTDEGYVGDYLQLNTAAAEPVEVGKIVWNQADGTADLGLKGGNVTLQIGQETVVRVVNKTGSNLLEDSYQVVRVRTQAEGGAAGQRLAVKLAQADTKANHSAILGLVTEDIDNNQEGFVTVFGNVNKINTTGSLQGQTWNDGDDLWLSESVAGGLTNIEPTVHPVRIGYVIYAHSNNGKIYVSLDNGVDELDELHNVSISDVSGGEVLTYNGVTQVWENKKVYNDLQIRRNGITIYDDLIGTGASDFFQKLTFNNGNWSVSTLSNENNPGVIAITSSVASASSGGSIIPSNTASPRNYAVGVGMQYDLILRTSELSASVIMRFGIVAGTTNSTQPSNGVYFQLNNNDLVGQTASGSVRSQTSAYTNITESTWYHFRVKMVSASLSVYELYDMDGTLLWTDSLTTNLPTIGEGVQPTFIAYNQIAEARQMCQVDYMSFTYPPMNRGALI